VCVWNSSALSEGESRKTTTATIARMHSLSDLLQLFCVQMVVVEDLLWRTRINTGLRFERPRGPGLDNSSAKRGDAIRRGPRQPLELHEPPLSRNLESVYLLATIPWDLTADENAANMQAQSAQPPFMDAVLAFWIASMASVCTNVKIHESRTNKEGTTPRRQGRLLFERWAPSRYRTAPSRCPLANDRFWYWYMIFSLPRFIHTQFTQYQKSPIASQN
jgi:hypothetical protein